MPVPVRPQALDASNTRRPMLRVTEQSSGIER